ncbi:MAG: DUF3990 domain-containing protein [Lachnospiraceae bacterium]|nr:DUF3990 domain-containing protein [Lachnospiraceae bacterium]
MIVYHGSTERVENPEIRISEIGRDFGFAFYTTDIEDQARRWAVRRAKIAERREKAVCRAVINRYDWDEKAASKELRVMRFSGPSAQWLDMVLQCRSDILYKHQYDIVIGNIANDNVGETVSYVMQGIMRREDAIERLKFEKINNQIAFCSQKSLQYLKYVETVEV